MNLACAREKEHWRILLKGAWWMNTAKYLQTPSAIPVSGEVAQDHGISDACGRRPICCPEGHAELASGAFQIDRLALGFRAIFPGGDKEAGSCAGLDTDLPSVCL